eukprot:c21284_g1_i1.p1 GENE.c21284_g1_i1~~c21284_g1_i1.p1  ORF type:complete len:317 (+),score=58.52 c21284_g1_i1:51-1001(+)
MSLPRTPPSLLGSTLGFSHGPLKCLKVAQRTQLAADTEDREDLSKRWEDALYTPMLCCCAAFRIILVRIVLLTLFSIVVCVLGNFLVALLTLPITLHHFYRAVVCGPSRLSRELRLWAAIAFPFLLLLSLITIPILSLFTSLLIPWLGCPNSWSLGRDAVGTYWSKANIWKKDAYQGFATGTKLDSGLVHVVLLALLPLAGAVIGMIGFLVVGMFEVPRVCFWQSFRSEVAVKYSPLLLPCSIVTATLYATVSLLLCPISGLISGFKKGLQCARHEPTKFFEVQRKNITDFMELRDRNVPKRRPTSADQPADNTQL